MSRLIVDVSGEQHQLIKALAATEGKSIKDYVLERVLPSQSHNGCSDEAAWTALQATLQLRILQAEQQGVSPRSVKEITDDTLRDLGKI